MISFLVVYYKVCFISMKTMHDRSAITIENYTLLANLCLTKSIRIFYIFRYIILKCVVYLKTKKLKLPIIYFINLIYG